jgi:hypothetical protein
MGKLNNSFSVAGRLDQDSMTLVEETKDEIKTYDLRKVLNRYTGGKVKFTIAFEEDDSEFLADEE